LDKNRGHYDLPSIFLPAQHHVSCHFTLQHSDILRPLKNAPFCSISASGSNFNPRNTQCIHVVKIIAFLELKPRLNIKNGFNWAGKN